MKAQDNKHTRSMPNLSLSKVQCCRSEECNYLFYFVYLLFGVDDSWTRDSVSDLRHFTLKINKNKNSIRYKNNFIEFQLLEIKYFCKFKCCICRIFTMMQRKVDKFFQE